MKRPSEQELLPVHAITILYELRMTLYLLLLPAARALAAMLRGTLEIWLRGTVFDFLVLLAALLVPVLRWKACRYQYAPEGLYLKRGVLWQRRYFLPDDSIVSVAITSPLFFPSLRGGAAEIFHRAERRASASAWWCRPGS